MKKENRENAIQLLDDYLTVLGCATEDLSRFSGAYLMLADGGCEVFDRDDVVCTYMGAKPSDINNYWNVSVLTRSKTQEKTLDLIKSQTIHWSRWDNFRRKFTNIDTSLVDAIAKYEMAWLTLNAEVSGRYWVYTVSKHDRLRALDPNEQIYGQHILPPEYLDQIVDCTKMLIGTAFMSPSFWVAKVSIQNDAPSISLITDPTGVKELWKFRDIPEGKKRRDALLHWVSDHWRVTRNDPDVEAYVRRQLRGSRTLICDGLSVEIIESKEDKVAVLEAQVDRRTMKQKNRDRRRRLKEITGG